MVVICFFSLAFLMLSLLARHMTAQLELYSPILSYYLLWADDQVITNEMQVEVMFSSFLWTGMWM